MISPVSVLHSCSNKASQARGKAAVIGRKKARCEVWKRRYRVFSQKHFGFGTEHRSIKNILEEAK
jgi:hypothetical protein